MNKKILKGRAIRAGVVEGEAVVTSQRLSFLGGVDPEKGMITEKKHELCNTYLKDKILVFPSLKGSAAGMWIIERLIRHNRGPKAMIVDTCDGIFIGGVVLGNIPAVEYESATATIKAGQKLKVNGEKGTIEILS